jgi:hypothetical protein
MELLIIGLIIIVIVIGVPLLYKRNIKNKIISEIGATTSSNKSVDFELVLNNKLYMAKVLYAPKNSVLQVNSKYYWQLNTGYSNRPGSAPRNKRLLTELEPFLKLKNEDKLLIIYPGVKHIKKYINESELEFVSSGDIAYDVLVYNYSDIDNLHKINT